MSETAGPSPQAYSKLAELELEFDKAEEELLKHQIELFDPIYVRRGAVLDTIQSFWTTILENFSPDIDEHITTEDWVFLGENITSINVTRPEKDTNPRTFEIEIGFKPDNGVVATTRLQKRFTYKALRSGDERWSGLVSEPVVVPWIDDKKDLTGGINALAIKIFELRKKRAEKHIAEKKEAANSGASKKSGAVKEDDGLADLEREMEEKLNQNQSFFNWFSWTGNHFMVMEREAEMKIKEEADKSKAKEGEEEEDDDEEDSDGADDGIDVFPYGEKLAYLIAEDLFPNALKHFADVMESDEALDEDEEDGADYDDSESIELDSDVDTKHKFAPGGQANGKKKRRGDDEMEDDENEGREAEGRKKKARK